LSFAEDLDGDGDEAAEEEETVVVKKRIVKNPNVNTSFLPGTNAQKYSFIVMLHSK
jgi:hypothetical protein